MILLLQIVLLIIGVGGVLVSAFALPDPWRLRLVIVFGALGVIGPVLTVITYEETPGVPHLGDVWRWFSIQLLWTVDSAKELLQLPALWIVLAFAIGVAFRWLVGQLHTIVSRPKCLSQEDRDFRRQLQGLVFPSMQDAFDGLIKVFAYLGKVDRERNAPDTATIQHFVHFATSSNNFFEPVKAEALLNIEDIDIDKLQDRIIVFFNEYSTLQNHIRMYNKTLKIDLSNKNVTKEWLEADKELRKYVLTIKASPRANKLQQLSENNFGSVVRVWAMP